MLCRFGCQKPVLGSNLFGIAVLLPPSCGNPTRDYLGGLAWSSVK